MRHSVRLLVIVLAGALGGYVIISPMLLSAFFGYDHGFGEGQRCDLAATVIGFMLGLTAELSIRAHHRARYSMRELLLGVAWFAITLTATSGLLAWVRSGGWLP